MRPRYAVGDHLIPLGNSDPTQIVTVVEVERESYRVALAGAPGPATRVETRARQQIDSDYVRVDLPVGGSWTRREDLPTLAVTQTPEAMRSPVIAETPTPTASAQADFDKVVQAAQPALVTVSVFDRTGKLTRSGAGFFISADGRIATALSNVEGAINAIASSGGKIYNVSGILAASPENNLAVVKADAKGVPFLPLSKAELDREGIAAAVVPTASRGVKAAMHGNLTTASDADSSALQLNGENLTSVAGVPVVDEHGEVVAIATEDESGASLSSIRSAKALAALVKIPTAVTPTWPAAGSPTPSPSPKATPSPSPRAPGAIGGLVYTPQPRYPTAARFSYRAVEGSGRFQIQFDRNGNAAFVQTVQSTGSDVLDNAALDTLRQWRARPGVPTQRTVPITFTKPR